MTKLDSSRIIFLHLPKAAGTTFNKILLKQYEESASFIVADEVKKELGDSWGRFTSMEREELAKKKLMALPKSQKDKIQLVAGHMEYGWHECFNDPATYITFLRNPVDRVISQFHYIKRLPDHALKDRILKDDLTLKQFVEQGVSLMTDNGMTRKIAGVTDAVAFREYDDAILDKAVRHLREHFGAVGLAEHFDESIVYMQHKFSWKHPYYLRKNVTINRKKVIEYDSATLDCIAQHNSLDIQLYQ
ncbi:MAG: sulfotransferase family 2 domain-containing protein [Marinoscillum sp.]